MDQKLTWEEIKQFYPDEWVAMVHVKGDLKSTYGPITGDIVAHHHDESQFTKQLKKLSKKQESLDIRYTGELLPDNPVGPILWQIFDTNF